MMIPFRKSLLWIALVTLLSTLSGVPFSSAAVLIVLGRVHSVKLLTADVGWVTVDSLSLPGGQSGRLFWTLDAGANWKDITPPVQPAARIESVFFLDPERGWVLLLDLTGDEDTASFEVATTTNAGASWSISLVNTEAMIPRNRATLSGQGRIAFSDGLHGWMNLDVQSGSAFRLGATLMTVDGGQTWKLPPDSPWVAGDLAPVSPNDVWLLGGPGEKLYVTHNEGRSWRQLELKAPGETGLAVYATYDLPTFSDAEHGFLPVTYSAPNTNSEAVLFKTEDGGLTWKPDRILGDLRESSIGQKVVSTMSGSVWMVADVSDNQLILWAIAHNSRTSNDVTQFTRQKVVKWVTADQLSFADAKRGWMLSVARLFSTSDGGVTWSLVETPKARRIDRNS
jgi:photosystem II stability/assembly factor-like uncharacterized protein